MYVHRYGICIYITHPTCCLHFMLIVYSIFVHFNKSSSIALKLLSLFSPHYLPGQTFITHQLSVLSFYLFSLRLMLCNCLVVHNMMTLLFQVYYNIVSTFSLHSHLHPYGVASSFCPIRSWKCHTKIINLNIDSKLRKLCVNKTFELYANIRRQPQHNATYLQYKCNVSYH